MKVIPFLAVAILSPAVALASPIAVATEHSERYVKLVLALGTFDPDFVDAYYGPPEWQKELEQQRLSLDGIAEAAAKLRQEIEAQSTSTDELERLRREYLRKQLGALEARVRLLKGEKLKFDEESRALYDAVAPNLDQAHFERILQRLEEKLPGEGSVADRHEKWRKQFVIPCDKLEAVFQLALAEARKRTAAQISLPAEERFTVEYVTGKPWGAYNWYKGDFRSVIQVNTDTPIYIDRAVDLAAHEGYPGHHVYNVLLEKNLVRDRGWVEFTVYPLFSPQSLIAEGTANFGRDVAFPPDDRMKFEKEVLWPAAGLDPTQANEYYAVQALTKELNYAVNEAARQYLNGEIDAAATAEFLRTYALLDRERAQQRVKFIDKYRSYVINYNLGEDMVKRYIEKRGGTPDQPLKRWQEFEQLLASPRLPSSLE